MKLGILDQIPLPKGTTVSQTLESTFSLAKEAERLGYSRYWIAEHHNTNGLLSAAPEILMTGILSKTSSIQVGSGGILLPQYSPLKVAEVFKTMEAMFPKRINLGIGRSPGGTERTRKALTDGRENNLSEFPKQTDELIGFLHNQLPKTHPYRMVKVTPRPGEAPPLWILGLSPSSGKLAGERGLGLVFGHFINPDKWEETLLTYRDSFKAVSDFDKPHIIVCVFVVCAPTLESAEELAKTQDRWLLGIEKGDSQIPSLEEVNSRETTPEEKKKILSNRRRTIIGTPEMIREKLEELSVKYGTDEFLLITNIHGQKERLQSYQLIAEVMELEKK
ncbi:LLM class flavin-dependent oxidoreductase [Jeotgalibacillus proteolyticus]|uniref:LLM class flavin-dependent oxidoreductase n=1 Tax=Jeotgalibacillus proteolyticus TaxID=2082395 RepID=A0A2S5GCQ9_9BACL|nr:LLM class flavin-dependent oxidoreductase [Jeotgalibacillus proteolyticus]PPA70694.1 LLM class flavin-dependent oxidoreductase [Jeotgalibacillus proteolyticus]